MLSICCTSTGACTSGLGLLRGACAQEGKDTATIKLTLDEEFATKHAFIGQDERGMPSPMGAETKVLGANFQFWKEDDNPTDDTTKSIIKLFCASVAEALNRYYAFGHVFSEEW
jgi:hypothetical protein